MYGRFLPESQSAKFYFWQELQFALNCDVSFSLLSVYYLVIAKYQYQTAIVTKFRYLRINGRTFKNTTQKLK